jgi:conjugative transfer region protein TrbK
VRGFGSRRLRAYTDWDAKAVRRALVLGALGAALIAAAVVMAGKEDEDGLRVRSSTLVAAPSENPLAAEFARCNGLGNAAVDDAGCRAAWAENRRRFFGGRAHPAPVR